jgi:predicted RNase H-like HicB family nuclease
VNQTYTAVFERDGAQWMAKIAEEPDVQCSATSLPEVRDQIRRALAQQLTADPLELRIVDSFQLPGKFRAAQEAVRATRTEQDREEMMAKMTGPISVREWAEDLGLSDRDPRTVKWLEGLEGVELNPDTLCAAITHAEDMSRWGDDADDSAAPEDILSEDAGSK